MRDENASALLDDLIATARHMSAKKRAAIVVLLMKGLRVEPGFDMLGIEMEIMRMESEIEISRIRATE